MEEALEYKDKGNALFKEHRYAEAIDAYTHAIRLDPSNPVFYSNRAQVHIKLEAYGLALQDCDRALQTDPEFLKAYYRKGVSHMALLDYRAAQTNFREVLKRAPGDRATTENLRHCVTYLKREAFECAISGDARVSVLASLDFDSMLDDNSWDGPALSISATRIPSEAGKDARVDVSISGLDLAYLRHMIARFKAGGRLPKKHVFAIVARAQQLFREEASMVKVCLEHPNIPKPDYHPEEIVLAAKKITVVGDTHGQFYDVLNIFARFGHVTDEHVYLFNGDFVDRGLWSCEVALYLYVLKILFPRAVFINRGNHETNDMNKTYGFTDECETKYSKNVFEAFAESFGALPLATLINRLYLVMHGGLFSNDDVTLADICAIDRFPALGLSQPPREGIAMELLWTDPQPENGRASSKRGLGIQFGPDITERFCLTNKIRKVVRSHEVRMDGVENEHNGRLITVFSAPNYCDSTGNLGGVVHIEPNAGYDPARDDGEGYRRVDDPNCPWTVLTETFAAVPHPDLRPMAYSKSGFGF